MWAAESLLQRGFDVSVKGLTDADWQSFRVAIAELESSAIEVAWGTQTALARRSTRVFGEYDFSQTVGIWLPSGLNPAAHLLSPFLSTDGFDFTPAEYLDLKDRIQLTLRKHNQLTTVTSGLDNLNTGFFRHREFAETADFIAGTVATFIKRGETLQHDYLTAINTHARRGSFKARAKLAGLREALSQFADQLREACLLQGRKQRRSLAEWLERLNRFRHDNGHTPVRAASRKEVADFSRLLELEWENYARAVKDTDRQERETAIALAPQTVAQEPRVAQQLATLSQRLEDYLRDLDEVGLYQLPLSGSSAATTPRQLAILEKALLQLRTTERYLPGLPAYFDQRSFWYAQPAKLRRLLGPLMELPPDNWEPAFTSWYLERCLEQYALDKTPPRPTAQAPSGGSGRGELSRYETDPGHAVDFTIDFSGSGATSDDRLSIQSVTDTNALHVPLRGEVAPWLFFVQPYHLDAAPDWASESYTESAGPLLASINGQAPVTFAEAAGLAGETVQIWLPEVLSHDDQTAILNYWEPLLSGRTKIRLLHNWTDAMVTSALFTDGLNGAFLAAILIRATYEAASDVYDANEMAAINAELNKRLGIPIPEPHPLAETIARYLRRHKLANEVSTHNPWRGTFLPLVVTETNGDEPTVYLPEGKLPSGGASDQAGLANFIGPDKRKEQLEALGYIVKDLDSRALWRDPEAELQRLFGPPGRS